jgi:chemotaxis protein MotA
LDILTIIGIALGFAAVVGGQVLEGGSVHAIMQGTAAIIVFGGTIGAVLLNYPMPTVLLAMKNTKKVFFNPSTDPKGLVAQIMKLSTIARRDGLLSLEPMVGNMKNRFLRKGLQLVIDGTEPKLTREVLEIEIAYYEEYNNSSAKVFESAGGYAPTIGIIGAVLGLIHVMENLAEPEKLGAGIAVAFVATVYGVASANLFWLPIAGKLKMRVREEVIASEMVMEGMVALSDGDNPRMVEEKLTGFLRESERK